MKKSQKGRGVFDGECKIKTMFKGQKTFAIRNDSIKRCDVHSENKFVLTKEIKVAKNLKSVLAVFWRWEP